MGPWNGCAKYDASAVAAACYQGDLVTLEMLLVTGDAENKFPGDVNVHLSDATPLMYAAQNGQLEAVKLMLENKADPHMKSKVPFGTDPAEGSSAKDVASKLGYGDVVAELEKAEKTSPKGKYMRYGRAYHNMKLPVYQTGETGSGKCPFDAVKIKDYVAGAKKFVAKPQTSIALLFPGQGSQYVKMMSALVTELPTVTAMCEQAQAILGWDIRQLCLEGPEDLLERTDKCQPAMFLAGAAGLEKLKTMRPEAVERPGCVAGLSLGEYTAMYAAGVFDFTDGMKLVKLRGEEMEKAAKSGAKQAMLSVAGLDQPKLEALCKQCESPGELCKISNILFPKGFSVGGTQVAIDKLKPLCEKEGALQAKQLKTGGAFHTELMQPAMDALKAKLNELKPKMKPPICDIYMNRTGKKIAKGTPPSEFIELMWEQLINPVQWEPSINLMIKSGISEFYEVGPMKQLKAMMKRIDQTKWADTINVDV
jgi:[acyl-carrier-protein] S-malonyltransferase